MKTIKSFFTTILIIAILTANNSNCAAEIVSIPILIKSNSPTINNQTFILEEIPLTTTITNLKQYFQTTFGVATEEQYMILIKQSTGEPHIHRITPAFDTETIQKVLQHGYTQIGLVLLNELSPESKLLFSYNLRPVNAETIPTLTYTTPPITLTQQAAPSNISFPEPPPAYSQTQDETPPPPYYIKYQIGDRVKVTVANKQAIGIVTHYDPTGSVPQYTVDLGNETRNFMESQINPPSRPTETQPQIINPTQPATPPVLKMTR